MKKTFRIQYKCWVTIWGSRQLWKQRGQRTYRCDNVMEAKAAFKRDRHAGRVTHNAEIIKIWELVS